jgi:hypothetical protein
MIAKANIDIVVKCNHCNCAYTLSVNPDDFGRWCVGEELIQDAMPYLSAGERELLISNTCDGCWEEMFGPSILDDDEDSPL